jgi:hypothetical protein
MTGPNYGDSQPQPLPIFVDSEIRVLEGSAAVESLRDRNDLKYLTQQGILQVDQARWQEAQRYERKTWMTNQVNANDDRNHDHKTTSVAIKQSPDALLTASSNLAVVHSPISDLSYRISGQSTSRCWIR